MTQTLAEEPVTATVAAPPQVASLVRRAMPVLTTVGVSFGIVVLQLAQGILLARLLGPEGRGEYATAILFVQMALYVGLFGAIEVVCRYSADDQVDRRSLRRSAFQLALITGGITTGVVIACNAFGLPADKQKIFWPFSLICALSVVGQQMTLVLSAVDRGAGDFARYNRIRLIAAAVFPAMLFLWAIVSQTTLLSTCVLLSIASLISVVPCFTGIKDQSAVVKAPAAKQLFREGRPYAMLMFATDLFERIDLILMLWLAPIVTQGYYNAMIPVAYPLTVIPNTLGLFLFNAGARQGSRLTTTRVRHLVVSSIGIQALTTTVFLLLVGPVVRLVYGEEFAPAIVFAMWLAPVSAIKGIVQGLESYVKGRGQPLATVRLRILSAVVMLIVIAILYPQTNVLSIVQGSLVGQLVCFFGLAIIVYKDSQATAPESFVSEYQED